MNWPSDADIVRLLEYCRRHAPEYLVDVYTTAIERRIVLGLILRDGPEVRFDADRPTLISVSDDVSRSTGPSGFNQATLVPAIMSCCAASVITAAPQRAYYADAVACAIQQQRNVMIVETTAQQESAWLKFLIETNPLIVWGVWTDGSTGAAQ